MVAELCASELVLKGLSFVLCETWLTTSALEPLRLAGASVATLVALPGLHPQWFMVEGQTSAVRQTRRFVERNEVQSAEIRDDTKELYFAAELLATALPLPLLQTAQAALRGTGLSGHHLSAVLEQMVQGLLRDFLKGGRVNWGGPLAECSPETAEAYFRKLRTSRPEIAQIVDEQLSWARKQTMKSKEAETVSTI